MKSWADIARAVFEAANGNGEKVVPVSTVDYYANVAGPITPRPVHSALDLSKLEASGFHMPDREKELGGVHVHALTSSFIIRMNRWCMKGSLMVEPFMRYIAWCTAL